MSFLASPTFFLWLLAASLPVIIYWLYRRRRTEVHWSANYILRRTIEQRHKRSLWRQIVILALRTLVLILIVLALARPFVRRDRPPGELPHGDGSLHQVVLIDNSSSMAIRYQAVTRAEEMLSRLTELLGRTRHGDYCDLIPMAVPEGQKLKALSIPCPASQVATKRVLESIRLEERAIDLQGALQLAAEKFSMTRGNNRHLLVLTDLSLKDMPSARDLRRFRPLFEKLGVKMPFYEIRGKESGNLAVTDFEVGADRLFAGWQYHFYITVVNYHRAPVQTSLLVRSIWNGQPLEDRALSLELKANERKVVDYAYAPPDLEGDVTLVAKVNDAGYQADNEQRVQVSVRKAAKLLLVRNDAEDGIAQPLWRDSFYFEKALRAMAMDLEDTAGPKKAGHVFKRDMATGRMIHTYVTSEDQTADARQYMKFALVPLKASELTADAFEDVDGVVLFQVTSLEDDVREALLRYVNRGGGLLVGLGDDVHADLVNETFEGLLPAPLADKFSPATRDRQDWDYDDDHKRIEKTFDHPILRRYLEEAEGPLENVRVFNYYRLAEPVDGPVLMKLSNGDPLLVEKAIGRGRAMLFTSTLGGLWLTFPVRNMYHSFVYAWCTYLTSFRTLDRNLRIGDPLILEAGKEPIHVAPPTGGSPVGPLAVRRVDGRDFVRYDGLSAPGEYAVLAGAKELGKYRVRSELVESDTLSLEARDKEALARNVGCTVTDTWTGVAVALAGDELVGWTPMGVFLLALLLCLLLDACLTCVWFR